MFGSAKDHGYVRVTGTLTGDVGQTRRNHSVSLMVSTRLQESFVICKSAVPPDPSLPEQQRPAEDVVLCSNVCESQVDSAPNSGFALSLYHAAASGTWVQKKFTLCVGSWCNTRPLTDADLPTNSLPVVANGSTLAPTTASPTVPPLPNVGCASKVTGDLKLSAESGIWGIAPGGLHPKQLTLCFGTGKRPGRILPLLEPDMAPTFWLDFTDEFILTQPSKTCTVQFVSPDVYDVVEQQTKRDVFTQIDTSSTFSWLPRIWFNQVRQSLMFACESVGCVAIRDLSDAASMCCFRFLEEQHEMSLPDLEWVLTDDLRVLVPPARYLYSTEDGSRCIGLFMSRTDRAVIGLNMLSGLRLRVDYERFRVKIDTCVSTDLLPYSESPDDTEDPTMTTPPLPGTTKTTTTTGDGGGGAGGTISLDPTFTSNTGGGENGGGALSSFVWGVLVGLFLAAVLARLFWMHRSRKSSSTVSARAVRSIRNPFASRRTQKRKVTFVDGNEEREEEREGLRDQASHQFRPQQRPDVVPPPGGNGGALQPQTRRGESGPRTNDNNEASIIAKQQHEHEEIDLI